MTVLITGGAGYIGSHTARFMHEKGYKVVIYDNLSTGHKEAVEGLPLIIGDILDLDLLKSTMRNFYITSVIHFAACSIVAESMGDPQKYYVNNISGTLNLLKAMLQENVSTLIFSSSAAVYGEAAGMPITEENNLLPTSVYGRTKLMIENILEDYNKAYGLRYVSLRYFNACGADEGGKFGEDHHPETHLIPLVLKTALSQRERLSIFGDDYPTKDGTCIRDYIHVSDLAEAHLLALGYLEKNNISDAFNLGNGNGFSVNEVITTTEKLIGKEVPKIVMPRRKGDPAILVANADKAKKILGWEPKYTDLKDIICTAWKWHENYPQGYNGKISQFEE